MGSVPFGGSTVAKGVPVRAWVLCFVLPVAAGCSGRGGGDVESACRSSRDCLGWQSCASNGACVPALSCGRQSDCVPGDACSPNGWCAAPALFDPSRVAIVGRMVPHLAGAAIAPVEAPTQLVALYPETNAVVHRMALQPDGRLVYLVSEVDTSGPGPVTHVRLRRFEPDAWELGSSTWMPPYVPIANDAIIPTPVCEPTEFVVRGVTGDLAYNCGYGTDWFDLQGTRIVEGLRIYAWLGDGAMLVAAPGDGRLSFRTPAGERLTTGEGPLLGWYLSSRARGAGFWVLAWNGATKRAERWSVFDGGNGGASAVLEGSYPARRCETPRPDDHLCDERVLDGEGRAYRLVWEIIDGSPQPLVERCTVNASACEVVGDPRLIDLPELPAEPGVPPPWMVHPDPGLPMLTGP